MTDETQRKHAVIRRKSEWAGGDISAAKRSESGESKAALKLGEKKVGY